MLSLENKEWKEFSLNELFSISGTITTHPSKLIKGGSVPRITCSSTTNGLDDLYSNEATEEGGVLTVDSAAIGYVAYQEKDFIATDHVEKIFMKDKKINRNLGLGLVTCIRNSTLNKFNYGYKFSQERIKKQKILLPINKKNEPDYEYMENYTKLIIDKKVDIYKKYIQNVLAGLEYKEIEPLENKEWKSFYTVQNNMYQLVKCKTLTTTDLDGKEGILDIVGATTKNNGNVFFANKKYKEYEINKNAICLIKTGQGSVGKAVYKGNNFIPSNNVAVLTKNNLNIYTGLFTTTLINKCNDRYSYGYIRNDKRIQREKIMLPINENNEPDFEYMEQYMKNIMYKKIMQYLNYKNKEA